MKLFVYLLGLIVLPLWVLADGVSLSVDNDLFADTDQAYTHGTKISYLSDNIPSQIDTFFEGREKNVTYTLAQYMYTPEDITIEELIEDDRPYGGWLYLGCRFSAYTPKRFNSLEIDLGVTGEWSKAEEAQKTVHRIIDSRKPMGWDNQLSEEVGIDLIWQEKWKFSNNKFYDIIPSYGAALGTIHTFANAGCMVRLGFNMPEDFGPIIMEPTNRKFPKWHSYLFASAEGRYVLRNFFLDGNMFKDSHSVSKENLVADMRGGISFMVCNFEIIYAHNFRTKEYKGQEHHNEFGSLIFSWKY